MEENIRYQSLDEVVVGSTVLCMRTVQDVKMHAQRINHAGLAASPCINHVSYGLFNDQADQYRDCKN